MHKSSAKMYIYSIIAIFVHLRIFPIPMPIIICIFSYQCGKFAFCVMVQSRCCDISQFGGQKDMYKYS